MKLKLAIGADHAGFRLKEAVKNILTKEELSTKTLARIQRSLVIIQTLQGMWQLQ